MPPCGRVGADLTTGHGIFPPVCYITGATTVYVNSMLCLTLGSIHPPHGHEIAPTSTLIQGSSTVLAEGKPIGRVADLCSCGECLATGSGNVIVGG